VIQNVRAITANLPNAAESACDHHIEVFKAVMNHDVIAAQEAMQEHMQITRDLLYKVIPEN
jgi:DNA-binding GntR family transcriptional regulator